MRSGRNAIDCGCSNGARNQLFILRFPPPHPGLNRIVEFYAGPLHSKMRNILPFLQPHDRRIAV